MNRTLTLTAPLVAAFALLVAAAPGARADASCPQDLQPLYGGAKTAAQASDADQSQALVKAGWTFFHKNRDAASAMRSFNQAWAADPDSAGAFHGLAVTSEVLRAMPRYKNCGLSVEQNEALFKTALAKPGATVEIQADYGRFLIYQRRSKEGLKVLEGVMADLPDTPGLKREIAFAHFRTQNYAEACTWAHKAEAAGEPVERGLAAISCKKAQAQTQARTKAQTEAQAQLQTAQN